MYVEVPDETVILDIVNCIDIGGIYSNDGVIFNVDLDAIYVASLRFKDKSLNENISHPTKQNIYKTITFLMYKK